MCKIPTRLVHGGHLFNLFRRNLASNAKRNNTIIVRYIMWSLLITDKTLYGTFTND